jgi:hypothetical protein
LDIDIKSLDTQDDGKIIVAGVSYTMPGIIRLNSDGSFDTSFDVGDSFSSMV